MSIDDFEKIKNNIIFVYAKDNHYTEISENTIMQNRLHILQVTDPYVGIYFSKDYIRRKILRLDNQEIESIKDELEVEKKEEPALPQGGSLLMMGGEQAEGDSGMQGQQNPQEQ